MYSLFLFWIIRTFTNGLLKKTYKKWKTLIQAASVGNETPNENSETHIFLNCEKGVKQVAQFYRRSKRKSGMYYSKSCQVADHKTYSTLFDNIHTLEKQIRNEKLRYFNCFYNQCIIPVNSLKLTKLVGNCPVLNYTLSKLKKGGLALMQQIMPILV